MDPREFCQLAMADYEQQWSQARGHQERHPIKVKMQALAQIVDESRTVEEFRAMLRAGCDSDDPIRVMLCQDLAERWDALTAAHQRPAMGG